MLAKARATIAELLTGVSDRDRLIVTRRYLVPEPSTLEALAVELNLSRERVRQISKAVMTRVLKRAKSPLTHEEFCVAWGLMEECDYARKIRLQRERRERKAA